MSRQYVVTTRDFGELIKTDDTIANARRWARTALPDQACTVRRLVAVRRCRGCDCSPCAAGCRRRHREAQS